MSDVTGKPRQTRLHVLLLAVKSHKNRLGCGHIVDTLITISTLQRVKRTRVLQVLRSEVRIDGCNREASSLGQKERSVFMTVMALDELRNAFARHRQLACLKQLSSAA